MNRKIEEVIDQLLEVLGKDDQQYQHLLANKPKFIDDQKYTAPEINKGWYNLQNFMNTYLADHPKFDQLVKIFNNT